jgi:hypothetical protein
VEGRTAHRPEQWRSGVAWPATIAKLLAAKDFTR